MTKVVGYMCPNTLMTPSGLYVLINTGQRVLRFYEQTVGYNNIEPIQPLETLKTMPFTWDMYKKMEV